MARSRLHDGRSAKHGRGFTLLELIVAATILSILTMMALPLARVTIRREKEKELRRALWEMRVLRSIPTGFCLLALGSAGTFVFDAQGTPVTDLNGLRGAQRSRVSFHSGQHPYCGGLTTLRPSCPNSE